MHGFMGERACSRPHGSRHRHCHTPWSHCGSKILQQQAALRPTTLLASSAEATCETNVPAVSDWLMRLRSGFDGDTHRKLVRVPIKSAVACGGARGRGRYIRLAAWTGLAADPLCGAPTVLGVASILLALRFSHLLVTG